MKRIITFTVGFLLIAFAFTWFALPVTMSQLLISLNNQFSGLSAKTVETEIGPIHYLEGGQGETIVLLHGIFARKEHWVDLARTLTPYYRVIAIDLPGFGDNQKLEPLDYELPVQAENLHIVMKALKIDLAHFAVNSMGAMVVGILAKEQPQLLKSLAFIGSPLGVPTKIDSDMQKAIKGGIIPLLVKNESDFDERNLWLFPEIPAIPAPILQTWKQQELQDTQINEQIWHAANRFTNTPNLIEIAPSLTIKTLILWCNQDRIFHVSGAEVLHEALPNSMTQILNQCGHLPMLDSHIEVSDLYLSFLSSH